VRGTARGAAGQTGKISSELPEAYDRAPRGPDRVKTAAVDPRRNGTSSRDGFRFTPFRTFGVASLPEISRLREVATTSGGPGTPAPARFSPPSTPMSGR
jgi:hypothetical protein